MSARLAGEIAEGRAVKKRIVITFGGDVAPSELRRSQSSHADHTEAAAVELAYVAVQKCRFGYSMNMRSPYRQ